ncbi:MAG: tRNA dihydrouridine synthase DusB [Chlorobi bacterium]|nr:tRNA dihydrouridine synthase DusB [Chlorobiota bacterium]
MFEIGHIKFEGTPVLLAPMEDVTDPSFRYMCKKFGADMVYTEFISSDGLIRDGAKSVKKLNIYEHERPVGIQIYGHDKEAMLEAAKIAERANPDLIDINYGCPVRKIVRRGAGAGMLKNIPYMIELTRAIVEVVTLPVTVKTRLGWDEQNKDIVRMAELLQDTGIKAITIHGRTGTQMYKEVSDWTLIAEVKKNPVMHIPVIGNGDIDSPLKAKEMLEKFPVDGIMIGRAAIGKPWLFGQVKHFLETGELLSEPSVTEKVHIAKEHFQKSVEWKGVPRGIYEMRRHFVHYFKGLPDFKSTRIQLLTSLNQDEIFSILDHIEEKYGS